MIGPEERQGSAVWVGLAKAWLPLLVWAGLIFVLSHQPDLRSGLPRFWDFLLRKLAHVTSYAVLTLLSFRAFRATGQTAGLALIGSIGFSVFYAMLDEYHQTFVSRRVGEIKDVVIDAIGIGLMGLWLLTSRWRSR